MAFKSVWLLLLVASTEVLGDIILRPSCATGWFYHKSNCYGYFRKLRNWSDAELECQSFGAHLASIQNLKEAKAISEYISGYQKNLPVWIGLHDPQKRQQWQWIDGTLYLFKTWASKSRSMAANKHCAEMNANSDFLTWDSKECHKVQHFLCKYRP
ncbi:PREDICTED: regenerating islet-derived protein 4 [Miniopterus natalensis]|uniref:regenerating islet-derived protein 4 n=1 Tax=Miniopterus natalensis TaxID=291302 RepID=UPI0007A6E876|nr:PREDICTED: regenerating islet-derived protein 4 [Miniopterus natalensis]